MMGSISLSKMAEDDERLQGHIRQHVDTFQYGTYIEAGDEGIDVGDPNRWSLPRVYWDVRFVKRCSFEVSAEFELVCFKSMGGGEAVGLTAICGSNG